MSPFDSTLVEKTDYFGVAVNPRPLVAGHAKSVFHSTAEWIAKIVGDDPETGAQVTIAWYAIEYEHKADASKRAREMFREIIGRRRR